MRALIRLFDAVWLNQTISTHNEYLHQLIITILNELLDIFMVLTKCFMNCILSLESDCSISIIHVRMMIYNIMKDWNQNWDGWNHDHHAMMKVLEWIITIPWYKH